MLFQINIGSKGLYDSYFESNEPIIDSLDYELFDDSKVDDFLKDYGYYDIWHKKQVHETYMYGVMAIKCAFLRLMILYELGGVYVDADVYFTKEVINLESHLNNRFAERNVVLSNRSLYFIKGIKKSDYIKSTLDLYLDAPYLKSDVRMTSNRRLKQFHKELMIVPEEYFKKYFDVHFTHTPI